MASPSSASWTATQVEGSSICFQALSAELCDYSIPSYPAHGAMVAMLILCKNVLESAGSPSQPHFLEQP